MPDPGTRSVRAARRSIRQPPTVALVAEAVVQAVVAVLPELVRRRTRARKPPQRRRSRRLASHPARLQPGGLELSSARRPASDSVARRSPRACAPQRPRARSTRPTPRPERARPLPSTRTWRPSGCQWKSSAARGFAASSRALPAPRSSVKKTKPRSSTPFSSTIRADGLPVRPTRSRAPSPRRTRPAPRRGTAPRTGRAGRGRDRRGGAPWTRSLTDDSVSDYP